MHTTRIELIDQLQPTTFGTAGLGFDLTAVAWPKLTQVFASGSKQAFQQCLAGRTAFLSSPSSYGALTQRFL
jgi:hypothetical protein